MANLVPLFAIFATMAIYLVHILNARSDKNRFSKILSEVTLAGTISAVSYCLYIMLTDYLWAYLAITVYCIAIDWLVYFVFVYVLILTEAGPRLTRLRIPLKILFFLDTIDLLFNCYFRHRFDLRPDPSDTPLKYFHGVYTPWNQVGNILSYAVTLLTVGILIYYTVKSNVFVRKRYLWVLIGYVSVLLVNVISVVSQLPLDFSIGMYFLGAMALAYGTRKVLPKPVLRYANELLLQNIRMMVMFFDLDGHCMFANKQANDFLDMSDEKGYQNADKVYQELYDSEELENQVLRNAEYPSEYKAEEIRLESVASRPYVRRNIWPLKDRYQSRIGYCLVLEDITEENRKKEEEAFKADHDPLTGLLNRDAFLMVGKKFLITKYRTENQIEKYNMISVNVLNFKRFNANFTTKEGDELLKTLAGAIQAWVSDGRPLNRGGSGANLLDATLRKEEILIGRMGADRFAFILSNEKNAEEVISKIREAVFDSFAENNYNYNLEIVFGICPISLEGTEKDWELNRYYDNSVRATQSIHREKSEYYAYYDADFMQKIDAESRLADEFEKALKAGEFIIYIQPQCDIHNQTRGGEALVRWKRSENIILNPGEFLSPLRKAGFIHKLDKHIWEEEGKEEYYLSVNIEPQDFYYMEVDKVIIGLTDRYQVDRKRLKLEITEATMAGDEKLIIGTLRKLRDAGYIIEVDDFGSDYSSLSRLKDIPAKVLKMDMRFFKPPQDRMGEVVDTDPVVVSRLKAITKNVLNMGTDLDMEVIAEGVETKGLANDLSDMGCRIFQGYGFDKPMPVKDFEEKRMNLKNME